MGPTSGEGPDPADGMARPVATCTHPTLHRASLIPIPLVCFKEGVGGPGPPDVRH